MPIPLTVLETRREARDERGLIAPPTEDVREKVFELEAQGQWLVQRVPEPWLGVTTKYGRIKKIPVARTWHHKSCGQCGHIPASSTSIFWLIRKLGAAYESGYFPVIHCGTSYGHYKEVREELVHSAQLRDEVRRICDKLGKPFVMPEEIVHYSEWIYAMRAEVPKRRILDLSGIDVTVHPACHYHKLVVEEAIYDPDVYGGHRTPVVSAG